MQPEYSGAFYNVQVGHAGVRISPVVRGRLHMFHTTNQSHTEPGSDFCDGPLNGKEGTLRQLFVRPRLITEINYRD